MNRRRARRNRRVETAELNITAFMNLMVILVPFLLITAVFSRLAVLELNLPTSQAEQQTPETDEFMLEITVRADAIEVGDRNQGRLSKFDKADDEYQLKKLGEYLNRIKEKFPTKTDATLLLEPDISYDTVVQVMDVTRVTEKEDDAGEIIRVELFPEISIGDAPMLN